jgi:3-hydroxyisobutyrate dehydrogenase
MIRTAINRSALALTNKLVHSLLNAFVYAPRVGRSCFSSGRVAPEASTTSVHVGFVGLGNMGLPMVLNLAKGEIVSSVVVFDTNQDACAIAKDKGDGKISIAKSVPEMVSNAEGRSLDAIFTMLPSCKVVDSVMQKLMDGFVENKVDCILDDSTSSSHDHPVCIVDCSTVNPSTSRKWNRLWLDSCGYLMYDAPVSGGVKGASLGSLTFMVGASNEYDSNCLEQQGLVRVVQPLLKLMGTNIIQCGSPGAGTATKLCNNVALAMQMVGVCEAMNLGERLGVDPVILANVMNVSTASCWSSKANNPHPVVAADMVKQFYLSKNDGPPASRDYEGGFATNLMWKDLDLALAAADESGGVAMPLTSRTKKLYHSASTEGFGKKDFGVMLQYLKTLDRSN